MDFFTMQKYDYTLRAFLASNNNDPQVIFEIGAQIIDAFKIVHTGGYTYNDLKLGGALPGGAKGRSRRM